MVQKWFLDKSVLKKDKFSFVTSEVEESKKKFLKKFFFYKGNVQIAQSDSNSSQNVKFERIGLSNMVMNFFSALIQIKILRKINLLNFK